MGITACFPTGLLVATVAWVLDLGFVHRARSSASITAGLARLRGRFGSPDQGGRWVIHRHVGVWLQSHLPRWASCVVGRRNLSNSMGGALAPNRRAQCRLAVVSCSFQDTRLINRRRSESGETPVCHSLNCSSILSVTDDQRPQFLH